MATPTGGTGTRTDEAGRTGSIVVLPDSAVIRRVPPTVPEPAPPKPPAARWTSVVIAALGALVVALLLAAFWAWAAADDTSSDLTAAQADLSVADDEIERLDAQVAMLEAQAARAQTEVEALEREVELLGVQVSGAESATAQAKAELASAEDELATAEAELAQTEAELSQARAALRVARDDLEAITGPPLPAGAYAGRLFMVGGTQVPPMLAFDEMTLLRGQDAIDAMIADGVPPAQAKRCGPECVYWRNPSPEWRVITIAPDTTVLLHTYPTPDTGPVTVDLVRFTAIFNGTTPRKARIAGRPYRLTIAGGEVTAIEEKNLSW